MSNTAAWVGISDLERKALKLLQSVDCPMAAVYASTGAPSTENSITCGYYEISPALLHYSPHCEALGSIERCPLLLRCRDAGDTISFLNIRLAQISRDKFVEVVQGAIGWREFKEKV